MPALNTRDLTARLAKDSAGAVCVGGTKSKCLTQGSENPPSDCLYCLAEWWLGQRRTGAEDRRFALADKLGLFTDERYLGRTDLPLARNYVRHRAIVRLAADKRFRAVVSLNWDLFLEAAFEAAGFPHEQPNPKRPGLISGYVPIIRNAQQGAAGNAKVFRVIKPHGCRGDLEEQRKHSPTQEPIFKVTYNDLNNLQAQVMNNQNGDVTTEIKMDLRAHPLVTAGWSASEPYLLDLVDQLSAEIPKDNSDRLAVIALERDGWTHGHERIAKAYRMERKSAFFGVRNDRDTDRLFLWIYSRFGLRRVAASIRPADSGIASALDGWEASMVDPDNLPEWCYDFFDEFLPTWCRLCWRMGGVTFFVSGSQLPPYEIPPGPRDWHVPFDTHGGANPSQSRRDLATAARLLYALKNRDPGTWQLQMFPGALWRETDTTLVVPVPLFLPEEPLDTVGSLGGLVEQWKRAGAPLHRVTKWRLLPLDVSGDHTTVNSVHVEHVLRRFVPELARQFQYANLASVEGMQPDRMTPMGLAEL